MTWPNFTHKEIACRCCGAQRMDYPFMDKVQELRTRLDFPFVVTSAYRCPQHNSQVSSTGLTGPHTTGRAIDIGVYGSRALALVRMAMEERYEITGIGVKQKGPYASRFIHLDDLDIDSRPWIWSY